MLRKRHFVWLLVAALLLSLSVAGLAETTFDRIDNADGSYALERRTDGVLEAKSYYSADDKLTQHENYDAAGLLTSKHVYTGDTTRSTEYYPNGKIRIDATYNDEMRETTWYNEEGIITRESSRVYNTSTDFWDEKSTEYNAQGNITYEEVRNAEGRKSTSYNKQGNITRERIENAEGSKSTTYYTNGSVRSVYTGQADGSEEFTGYYLDGSISEKSGSTADGGEKLI
ncbi:MAG: hypothetical protein GX650_04265, partial [Clostridiales bacterium]|nr:hypothetical protein [Clostridiales bacterium]